MAHSESESRGSWLFHFRFFLQASGNVLDYISGMMGTFVIDNDEKIYGVKHFETFGLIRSDAWANSMSYINKLMGFYELQESGLPSVPWKKFSKEMVLDANLLWTVRTAVTCGDDLNLPRKVGVSAEEAYHFACEQSDMLGDKGLVVIYPYFIAEKSGTLEVKQNAEVIEGVYKDLWNFVTENKKDITIFRDKKSIFIQGKEDFFDAWELEEMNKYIEKIRKKFRNSLLVDKSILLEWSFAYDTDVNNQKIGNKYLVFYEVREI